MSLVTFVNSWSQRTRVWVGLAGLGCMVLTVALVVRVFSGATARQWAELDFDSVRPETIPVQGNVYMLSGLGGNISVQIGEDGVLLVDSQYAQLAEKNLVAIAALSRKRIEYIINTHAHIDHVGGNAGLGRAPGPVDGPAPTGIATDDDQAIIMAHRNVLLRLAAPEGGRPSALWPTDVYGFGERTIRFNGENIRLLHQPAAHTDGDTFVYFEASNVIAAGDIYNDTHYPYIDKWTGGSFKGIVAGLERLLDMIVNDGRLGTLIVPGHGQIQSEADAADYYNMILAISDRIQNMIDSGMTVEEIIAARPTQKYDSKYGSETGWWSTSDFVREVALEFMVGDRAL